MLESSEELSEEVLREDKILLEIGHGLIHLVGEDGPLRERITALRRSIARDTGMPVTAVRIRDNAELQAHDYRVLFLGAVAAAARLPGGKFAVLNPENRPGAPAGPEYTEPAYGMTGVLVEVDEGSDAVRELEAQGFLVLDDAVILATHLDALIRSHAPELLGRAEAVRLLKATRGKFPGLVNEFLKAWQAGELRTVLALMLEEGLSIGYMPIVLEVFAENARAREAHDEFKPEEIYAAIRGRLKNVLCANIIEADHMSVFATNEAPSADEAAREALRMSMRGCIEQAAGRDIFPVVLTPGAIRLEVFRALAAGIDPSLFKVLCRGDIPYGVEIDIIGRLSPADAPDRDVPGNDSSESAAGRTYEEGRREGFLAGLKQGLALKNRLK